MEIRYNLPHITGREIEYIRDAIKRGRLAGNGDYTKRCQAFLCERLGAAQSLLTGSCTAALEMAAILAQCGPGDEVIMPSFTFVSTANAFVLRGAVPVFVDVRSDTLNLDERLLETALTPRTRAIVPVHYAGVACEMDTILEFALRHDLLVIEDAAQGMLATYKGRHLGTLGNLSALSFHETKNIISGEGGALLINDPRHNERAEIIWEKGTNRAQYFRGEVDKYTWVDIGSSFLPSEITAAFLLAQLQEAEQITAQRVRVWNRYHALLSRLGRDGQISLPHVPGDCVHNGHIFYFLAPSLKTRAHVLEQLKQAGIHAVFHYVPLHDTPTGRHYGRAAGSMDVTESVANRIVRLPIWPDLMDDQIQFICENVERAVAGK